MDTKYWGVCAFCIYYDHDLTERPCAGCKHINMGVGEENYTADKGKIKRAEKGRLYADE